MRSRQGINIDKTIFAEKRKQEMFKWLFAIPPAVGSLWRIPSNNPFDEYDGGPVQVVEIKFGWVKYKAVNNKYSDELPIRSFRSTYKELGKGAPAKALIPIGSIWRKDSTLYPTIVKILDVREDWVRCQMSGFSNCETISVKTFLSYYKKYPFTEDFKEPSDERTPYFRQGFYFTNT